MIAHLTGTVLSKNERSIIVDVANVGYEVYGTETLLSKLQEDRQISLFIYTAVREDAISLYGFETNEELNFFKLLLTVSRVGPRSALEILNAGYRKVKHAIQKKNVAYLSRVPGVGKKTAERIILELHGKVESSEVPEDEFDMSESNANEDIIQALIGLGYQRTHVLRVLKKVPPHITEEKKVIEFFLKTI